MSEEGGGGRVSSDNSTLPSADASSQPRQRKRRKWDQPAESLVSAIMTAPGVHQVGNITPHAGVSFGAVGPIPIADPNFPFPVNCASMSQQHTPDVLSKMKIQEELIAREIVINDAESAIRYKLTKRQTQDEIQKCTGAVVITRGKYRPPNALPDGEKPLYLHISAGAHLKEMAEKILAVDRAAAMVEEMLQQSQVGETHSSCIYLGFDADPSLDIASRIRGPNDQYINHIMNETGATVLLKGSDTGNYGDSHSEGAQEPLHLFLSSNNFKSLEDAKCLAENLMDTISKECGVSRVSSYKVYSAVQPPQQVYGAVPLPHPQYSAVPPPQQLLVGIQSSGNGPSYCSASVLTSAIGDPGGNLPISSHKIGVDPIISQSGELLVPPLSQAGLSYPRPAISGGTSYNGYGGIYPQATALQQVALALRQSSSSGTSMTYSMITTPSIPKSSICSSTDEKRARQKRKFQELPTALKDSFQVGQDSEFLKPLELAADTSGRNAPITAPPKKLAQASSVQLPPPPVRGNMPPPPPVRGNMPPPPPVRGSMPPPPVPPKSLLSKSTAKDPEAKTSLKTKESDTVPDTLVKLMEYGEEDGDEDEDEDEHHEESLSSKSGAVPNQKPFWAL